MQFEYELVLLTRVQPTDGEKNKLIEAIKSTLEKTGFSVEQLSVNEDISGRRKLGYEIKGNQEAHFSYFKLITSSTEALAQAQKELKFNKAFSKEVVRYMFVKKDNL